MEPGGARRTSFAANLITPRTILIFAAGFLLALFLARTLPDVGLFHPEGRIIEKEIVITYLNPTSVPPERIGGITTREREGFATPEEVWDDELLEVAKSAGFGHEISVAARIKYVVSPESAAAVIWIRERE